MSLSRARARTLALLAGLLHGWALAGPDWAALEGELNWPTNFHAAREAVLARHPEAQRLNVRDFGARGDGVADDTRAVQRALDAAFRRQRALVFPPGVYRLGTLVDTSPHAFLTIGHEGRPGSLVLLGEGEARLWSDRQPPGMPRWPTSPLLRVFAGVTNLLVQGLAFDRSGARQPLNGQGGALGNGDHAGGLQVLPGRGQQGVAYIGIFDCEFLNCHHAFGLYPRPLSLDRNAWRVFPENAFDLVHVAGNRFLYTNEFGGTATWFDGVRLLVAEDNRFDGQLDNVITPNPALKNRISNRTSDGWLYGQCEQLWARGNHIRNASFELLAYTFGYRLLERARAYDAGESVVFHGDLWATTRALAAGQALPGEGPAWRRIATNYHARFVHRFLDNVVEGQPTPGATTPGAFVGLRTDLATLVAVSNRFEGLLEGILMAGRPYLLESATGTAAAGSVIRGNTFTDCLRGVVLGCGPALVAENAYTLTDDRPRQVNEHIWHPVFLRLMEDCAGTLARGNRITLERRVTSSAPGQRTWAFTPNAAVAFLASNGLHACAEGNRLTGLACGVLQGRWNGTWTLRGNVWEDVPAPWEGTTGNFIADETLPLPTLEPGWYLIANLNRAEAGEGALELAAARAGQPIRYRFALTLTGRAEGSLMTVEADDPAPAGERLVLAAYARADGALLLGFGGAGTTHASVRFTTTASPAALSDCARRPASGIRWRWPGLPAQDVPPGLLPTAPRRDLLLITNGLSELPLFR